MLLVPGWSSTASCASVPPHSSHANSRHAMRMIVGTVPCMISCLDLRAPARGASLHWKCPGSRGRTSWIAGPAVIIHVIRLEKQTITKMNAVKRNRFAALAVLAALPWAGAWACEGRVMAADGQAGVAGALVSDGRAVVASGEDGSFRLPDAPARLFVVAPDGWTVPRGDDGLPAFWREGCGDLRLEREDAPRADASRVLVFSDPQTPSPREVEYYARGAVATAAKEPDIAFGVTLGDITQDEPALYPALNRVTATLGVPWLHLPGNHDIDP